MRLDAVSVGRDPPNEVNVVVEVPVGGEPIKYEMDKASGRPHRRSLPVYRNAVSRQLRIHSAHTVG